MIYKQKRVGLDENSDKLLEFSPFGKYLEQNPALLKLGFEDSYRCAMLCLQVQRSLNNGSTPYSITWTPILLLFHHSFETGLKCLIKIKNDRFDKIHNLYELYQTVMELIPDINVIEKNVNSINLLKDLGNSYINLKYYEGTLFLSHKINFQGYLQTLVKTLNIIYENINKQIEIHIKQY